MNLQSKFGLFKSLKEASFCKEEKSTPKNNKKYSKKQKTKDFQIRPYQRKFSNTVKLNLQNSLLKSEKIMDNKRKIRNEKKLKNKSGNTHQLPLKLSQTPKSRCSKKASNKED